jgi:hypothetical protein
MVKTDTKGRNMLIKMVVTCKQQVRICWRRAGRRAAANRQTAGSAKPPAPAGTQLTPGMRRWETNYNGLYLLCNSREVLSTVVLKFEAFTCACVGLCVFLYAKQSAVIFLVFQNIADGTNNWANLLEKRRHHSRPPTKPKSVAKILSD